MSGAFGSACGRFGPAGTPNEVIGWLDAEIKRALDDDTVQRKLGAAGVQPKFGASIEITRMLEWRILQWADVIKSAGIRIN